MLTSKVTSKGQTTLPGDHIVYRNTSAGVLIRKARPFDAAWHSGISKTLEEEWNSREDEQDFRDL